MAANTVPTQGTILEVESASAGVYVEVGEVQGFTGPGGAAKVIPTTNLRSTRVEKRMGLPDEGQFSIDFNRWFSDTGQARMKALRASLAQGNFRVTYVGGTVQSFAAFVLEFSTSGQPDDLIKGKATLEITGAVTEV